MATDYVSLCQDYEEANKKLKGKLLLYPEDENIKQEIEENEKQLKILRKRASSLPEKTEIKEQVKEEKKKAPSNIAPTLRWNHDKWNNKGTYNKDKKTGYYFYQLPLPIMDYINETLDGKKWFTFKNYGRSYWNR